MPEVTPVRAACIILAAGSGSRLGAEVPKAFALLAGEPLLAHAVRKLLASQTIDQLVVVAPPDWLGQAEKVAAAMAAGQASVRMSVVVGGAERQDSVAAGLEALADDVQIVLVHDAARCLAPPSLVVRVADAVGAGHAAVVPGLPVADTIKRVAGSPGGRERVAETVDRNELRIAQTPQGFDRSTLVSAHTAAREQSAQVLTPLVERFGAAGAAAALAPLYTDDAEMAELVTDVVIVPGDPLAFKITSAQDLAYAEWVLSRER
jgi:2-C-methyl-D-erythritol 4-phosphate cytidylyltransferase